MKTLFTIRCQQCFTIIPRKLLSGTLQTQLNARLPLIQSTSFNSLPQFLQVREAFLRAGPGREHGSSFKTSLSEDSNMDHQPSLQDQSNITEPDTHTSTKLTLSPHKPPTAPYKEIILLETDFKEKFIKGGGNGGQKINKTNSNVELKHLETGIVVQCQATRALSQNRKLARKILIERLDEYYNGEMSKRGQKAEKIRQRKMRMARKSAKKYHSDEKMETDEANEGDDNEDYNEEEDTYEKKNNSRGNTSGAKLGKPPVPDINIQFTTLEEILSGDNKKISRRKAGRKE